MRDYKSDSKRKGSSRERWSFIMLKRMEELNVIAPNDLETVFDWDCVIITEEPY